MKICNHWNEYVPFHVFEWKVEKRVLFDMTEMKHILSEWYAIEFDNKQHQEFKLSWNLGQKEN